MGMEHTQDILEKAERIARNGSMEDCLRQLRHLSLDDFALLMLGMPDTDKYPGLSSVLPAMASVISSARGPGRPGTAL